MATNFFFQSVLFRRTITISRPKASSFSISQQFRPAQNVHVDIVFAFVAVDVLGQRLPQLAHERSQRWNGVAIGNVDERGNQLVPKITMDVASKRTGTNLEGREDGFA